MSFSPTVSRRHSQPGALPFEAKARLTLRLVPARARPKVGDHLRLVAEKGC